MLLMRLPAAVVFDMDGLLFDTERLYEQAAIAAAAQLGHEMTQAFFRSTVGLPWLVIRERLLEHFGEGFAADVLRGQAQEHFQALVEANLPLKPGVLELLGALDERGLPAAIATTSSQATVQHHLQAHGLAGRFSCVVAHDDCDQHKPSPEPFLKAAARLGVGARDCLALEDSHDGVRSAAAAGMTVIMIPDLIPPNDEIRALCSLVADDLHEVRRLIAAIG
jgi:HAD superfamily hydrolase (TIGR01509 family)